MRANELSRLQSDLARLLTSVDDGETRESSILGGVVRAEDLDRILVFQRMTLGKRVVKISNVIPRVLCLLGGDLFQTMSEFANEYPPAHLGPLSCGVEFCQFLAGRWSQSAANPEYLPEVADLELHMAHCRFRREPLPETRRIAGALVQNSAVRISEAACVRRSEYDVSVLFQGEAPALGTKLCDAPKQITSLACVFDPSSGTSEFHYLSSSLFSELQCASGWLQISDLGANSEVRTNLQALIESGILTTR